MIVSEHRISELLLFSQQCSCRITFRLALKEFTVDGLYSTVDDHGSFSIVSVGDSLALLHRRNIRKVFLTQSQAGSSLVAWLDAALQQFVGNTSAAVVGSLFHWVARHF